MNKPKQKRVEQDTLPGTETALDMVAIDSNMGLMAGFVPNAGFEMPSGTIIKSLSPLIKPAEFPTGIKLVGKFTRLFTTHATKEKLGAGIEIIPHGMPVGIAIPATRTLQIALEIDDAELGDKAKSPYIGRYIIVEKLPNKIPSKQGQDAWNFLVAILPEDYVPPLLNLN